MPLANATTLIDRVFDASWRPREKITVDEWADRYRMVVSRASPRPGPWETDFVPYMREPMRCFTDPEVREIVMMTSTQIGKTELILNCVGYTVDVDPYPTIWAMDSQLSVEELNKQRLRPTLLETERLAMHLPKGAASIQVKSVDFDTMPLWLTGANSAGRLASKPCGLGLADEIDKWAEELKGRGRKEGSALELLRKRGDAYGDGFRMVITSTPTEEMVGIDAEYESSDKAVYWAPCPHCRGYQPLRFGADGKGGVRWEGGLNAELTGSKHEEWCEHVRLTAWYECEHCAGRIENHHKPWMMKRGKWVRDGQSIDPADPSGTIIGDAPKTSVRGFHLSQLHAITKKWGDVAYGFVKARGVATRGWVNSVLGEPWRPAGQRADEQDLLRVAAASQDRPDAYAMSTVPEDALVLTIAIDVQLDHVYYEVAGWGEHEAKFVIDIGIEPCPEIPALPAELAELSPAQLAELGDEDGGDPRVRAAYEDWKLLVNNNWARVLKLAQRRYYRVDLETGEQIGDGVAISYGAIDSGFRTGEVYRVCAQLGPNWIPIKGEVGGTRQPTLLTTVKNAARYGLDQPLELMVINADYWKTEAFGRMSRTAPALGAHRYPFDLPRTEHGPAYARHLTSEHRVRKDGKAGARYGWEMRPGRRDNHWWDCTVYNQALADLCNLSELRRDAASDDTENYLPSGGNLT